jgi:hypothetical protein
MKVRWRELPQLLSANGIDALVLDDYDFYSEVVPMYLGMPYARSMTEKAGQSSVFHGTD